MEYKFLWIIKNRIIIPNIAAIIKNILFFSNIRIIRIINFFIYLDNDSAIMSRMTQTSLMLSRRARLNVPTFISLHTGHSLVLSFFLKITLRRSVSYQPLVRTRRVTILKDNLSLATDVWLNWPFTHSIATHHELLIPRNPLQHASWVNSFD